jgi:hypothetical protein
LELSIITIIKNIRKNIINGEYKHEYKENSFANTFVISFSNLRHEENDYTLAKSGHYRFIQGARPQYYLLSEA